MTTSHLSATDKHLALESKDYLVLMKCPSL